jgi:hypothetical protein
MSSKAEFNLRSIVEESIIEIQEFESVHSYLLEISEGELSTRQTKSSLIEIAKELLSRFLSGEHDED